MQRGDFERPLPIGQEELDRLRSIIGPPEPRLTPAIRRTASTPNAPELDERSPTELLRDIDRKLDKVLEGGDAIDHLRAQIAELRDEVAALTTMVANSLQTRGGRTGPVRVTLR